MGRTSGYWFRPPRDSDAPHSLPALLRFMQQKLCLWWREVVAPWRLRASLLFPSGRMSHLRNEWNDLIPWWQIDSRISRKCNECDGFLWSRKKCTLMDRCGPVGTTPPNFVFFCDVEWSLKNIVPDQRTLMSSGYFGFRVHGRLFGSNETWCWGNLWELSAVFLQLYPVWGVKVRTSRPLLLQLFLLCICILNQSGQLKKLLIFLYVQSSSCF